MFFGVLSSVCEEEGIFGLIVFFNFFNRLLIVFVLILCVLIYFFSVLINVVFLL